MKQLTLQEAVLAWAQGKKVQASPYGHLDDWAGIDRVGEDSSCNRYTAIIFDSTNARSFRFRLAPEPPAKKWRPWKPEEVPLDAWFMRSNGSRIGFRLAYAHLWSDPETSTVANASGEHHSLAYIFEHWKHSVDGGKTWIPCGVEVES